MRRLALGLALGLVALTGCGSIGGSPTPLPTVVLDRGGGAEPGGTAVAAGGATASGTVISPGEASLAFGQGGVVHAVRVAVGDSVRAGEMLVELESELAQLEVARAQRALRELTSEAAIAQADQAVAIALEAQDEAQKKVNSLSYPRATEGFIDNIQAQIALARRELAEATNAFSGVTELERNDPERARAQIRLSEAQANLNRLLGNYNWYTGHPSEIEIALRHANLAAATAAVQEAQWYLAALRDEPIPADASGVMLAALEEARDALAAAQVRLHATRLTSPVDGVIGAVAIAPGEFAAPGQPVVTVTDLVHLQVETTDLSELDLSEVAIGQPATVFVEALGAEVPAHVVAISPTPQLLGGDVVYAVRLDLDEVLAEIRPGMTVTVSFGAIP